MPARSASQIEWIQRLAPFFATLCGTLGSCSIPLLLPTRSLISGAGIASKHSPKSGCGPATRRGPGPFLRRNASPWPMTCSSPSETCASPQETGSRSSNGPGRRRSRPGSERSRPSDDSTRQPVEAALWPTLADAVSMLAERGLRSALIGGLAVSLRGQPRMTVAVDLVVLASVDAAIRLVADLASTPFDPLFPGVEEEPAHGRPSKAAISSGLGASPLDRSRSTSFRGWRSGPDWPADRPSTRRGHKTTRSLRGRTGSVPRRPAGSGGHRRRR